MPIPFSLLPEHLRMMIVEKQNAEDFVKFNESTREAMKIAKRIKAKFPIRARTLFVEEVQGNKGLEAIACFNMDNKVHFDGELLLRTPIRIVAESIVGLLTSSLCELLVKTNTTSSSLNLQGLHCRRSLLNDLFYFAGIQTCRFREISTLGLRNFTKNNNVSIRADCYLSDEDLLFIKTPNLMVFGTNTTSSGINLLIKQWLNGKREIIYISLETVNEYAKDAVLDGIEVDNVNSFGNYVLKRPGLQTMIATIRDKNFVMRPQGLYPRI